MPNSWLYAMLSFAKHWDCIDRTLVALVSESIEGINMSSPWCSWWMYNYSTTVTRRGKIGWPHYSLNHKYHSHGTLKWFNHNAFIDMLSAWQALHDEQMNWTRHLISCLGGFAYTANQMSQTNTKNKIKGKSTYFSSSPRIGPWVAQNHKIYSFRHSWYRTRWEISCSSTCVLWKLKTSQSSQDKRWYHFTLMDIWWRRGDNHSI